MDHRTHDSLGRRTRYRPQPLRSVADAPIVPSEGDILMFQATHHHGPLSSVYLAEFRKQLHPSFRVTQRRLTLLANETNTIETERGPYLSRPPQQKLTEHSHSKHLVYDLTPASIACLKRLGLWHPKAPSDRNPWTHAFMVSAITASIELACRKAGLRFVHGFEILERSGATLRQPVAFKWEGQKRTVDLIPDGLFAIEYPDGFRAFLVEADRNSEPLRPDTYRRKSALRNLLQYRSFVGDRGYKAAYGLNTSLKVLNICSHGPRMKGAMDLIAKESRDCSWMLFQDAPEFGIVFTPPPVLSRLFNRPWKRVGHSDFRLSE